MDDGHEQSCDAGGWDGNDEDGANNDGGGCVMDKDDSDCFGGNALGHWNRDYTKEHQRSRKFRNG